MKPFILLKKLKKVRLPIKNLNLKNNLHAKRGWSLNLKKRKIYKILRLPVELSL
jgi:hypothetical protein